MKDSLQKAKKGKRKSKRPDTREPPEDEAKLKERLKAHAQEAIEFALWKGDSLDSHKDIVRILRSHLRDRCLPRNHFDLLDPADHCDLYIYVTKSPNRFADLSPPLHQPTLHTQIKHGQTTPVQSPATTECDGQSEGRAEQDRDEAAREEDLVVRPLEGDEGEMFNVNVYHASYTGPEVVKAYYCQNARSYISVSIIKRHRLTPDPDESIRLAWEESDISRQGPKMKSTRFLVVEDDKVRNDLAIGKEWDQADELDYELSRLDLDHCGGMDEALESEEDGEDEGEDEEDEDEDSSQDGSEEEEDAGDDDEEGLSEASEVEDGEYECEDGADVEQRSSDDSYVRVSAPNQLILQSTWPAIRYRDRGYRAAAKVLRHLIEDYSDDEPNQPSPIPGTTKVGRSQSNRASSKLSLNLPRVKGTTQRATGSKQPAFEPESKTRKKHRTTKSAQVLPKRRDSGLVSHVSNENPPLSRPSHLKTKKKR